MKERLEYGKFNIWGLRYILSIIDYIAIISALWISFEVRTWITFFPFNAVFDVLDVYSYLIIPSLFLLNLWLFNSYEIEIPYWEKVNRIFKSVTTSVILFVFFLYASNSNTDISRFLVGLSWVFTFLNILVYRYIVERILIHFGKFTIPILMVGAGKTADLVYQSLIKTPMMRYQIIGYVDDRVPDSKVAKEFTRLGGFDNVEDVIKFTGVETVLVCAPGLVPSDLVALVTKLQLLVRKVGFVPELIGIPAGNISARGLMDEELVILRVKNNLARKSYRLMKRIFDLVVTLLGGIFVFPIGLIIAVLIYIDSPGAPVIFSHKRVGRGGKEFPCYKFRSMIPNAQEALETYLKENPKAREEWERDFKLKDDPRITKLGAFLRKTSLDELPQLLNVLKGEMSLVGPRPIVKAEIKKYGEYIHDFYLVPPGITGVWQVNGRSDTTYDERIRMDSWYVHNWSVWIDIVYLVKTVMVVLQRKGAY